MKITVNQENNIELLEVFNPISLRTPAGELMTICMRDGGFEFTYEGKQHYAKCGVVSGVKKSEICFHIPFYDMKTGGHKCLKCGKLIGV